MPFTSETGKSQRMLQIIQNLTKQVDYLSRTNRFLMSQMEILKAQNNELTERLSSINSILNGIFKTDGILSAYLKVVSNNINKLPQGHRFSQIKEFVCILSFMGPHYYELLHENLLLPSYRTALHYKNELFNAYSINNSLFDANIEHVTSILSNFLPRGFSGKLVLMADAACVTPYVSIANDGQVTGLLETKRVGMRVVHDTKSKPTIFQQFLNEHQHEVIQAEFGLMIGALDPSIRPLPIGCIPSTSGKATYDIVEKIEKLVIQMRDKGFNVIGLATDGDQAYNKYSIAFIKSLSANFDQFMISDISNAMKHLIPFYHFSDPYHLTKRDRYRKISLDEYFIYPLDNNTKLTKYSLHALNIPKYLLDDDKGRKQEDILPRKLFNFSVLAQIIERNDANLFISMLPSTLLLESIHSESLARQSRIHCLLLGGSLVLIYYFLIHFIPENDNSSESISKSELRSKVCFTEEWCREYIFTAFAIADQLCTEKDVHMGVLGDHFLEHLFGNIRRLSKGDDTHPKFIKSLKDILLERCLLIHCGLDHKTPVSRCDSGQKLTEIEKIEILQMKVYLEIAKAILANSITVPEEEHIIKISNAKEKFNLARVSELFELICSEKNVPISTKSMGILLTGGLANIRRWQASCQFSRLNDESNDENSE